MAEGWIKLHRGITNNPLWTQDVFSRGQAWVDLLLMVNHEDKKILFDGGLVECKRGERILSIRHLSERWKWSRDKTKRFLDLLQSDGMITYKTDHKKTIVNVVNYSVYQDTIIQEKPVKSHRKATEKPLTDTNKNEKNEKNDKEDKKYIYIREFTENKDLIKTIIDFMKMREKIKKPVTDRALKSMINKLNELSKDESIQIKILEQSIFNCWQGIFPLKEGSYGSTGQNTGADKKKYNVKPSEWKPKATGGDDPI
ncbi:hypothetical protein [Inconstantimicrobium mannanitabidum]|uniref:GntR family transcriptional regulator n=1 Tax=Inconstantimicrobium mannanitabidum TaxID=1604901 RepID=A0ACB5R8W5_9CLOT|nr:hypothetical protein [Clostridium sp. TW13]GKX65617.1 GntR family transcriptional regulator [Clostridium sp. TW13]